MSRIGRVGLAAMFLVSGVTALRLTTPSGAIACSCLVTGPEQIGKVGNNPSTVVFVGTVVSMDGGSDQVGHTRGVLLVQQLFKGSIPSNRVPVIGGGGGDCTMRLVVGQRMITAASFEDGAITPGLCAPYGDPATPEGQQLIAEATKAYGAGVAPPGAPSDPTASPSASDAGAGDPALPLAVVAAVGIAILLFGSVIVLTRRTTRGRER